MTLQEISLILFMNVQFHDVAILPPCGHFLELHNVKQTYSLLSKSTAQMALPK